MCLNAITGGKERPSHSFPVKTKRFTPVNHSFIIHSFITSIYIAPLLLLLTAPTKSVHHPES